MVLIAVHAEDSSAQVVSTVDNIAHPGEAGFEDIVAYDV